MSLWLKRVGLGKHSQLEPPEPPNRYERSRPGELVHVDIKQLGRISKRGAGHRAIASRKSQGDHHRRRTGFEFVHVMVDDHSRLAYADRNRAGDRTLLIGVLPRPDTPRPEGGNELQRLQAAASTGTLAFDLAVAETWGRFRPSRSSALGNNSRPKRMPSDSTHGTVTVGSSPPAS